MTHFLCFRIADYFCGGGILYSAELLADVDQMLKKLLAFRGRLCVMLEKPFTEKAAEKVAENRIAQNKF